MNTKDYQKIIKRQDLNIHFDTKARVLSRSDWCPFEHRLKMLRLLIFLRIVFAEIFSHFLFPRAAIKVLPNKMAKLVSRSLPVLLLNLWHQNDNNWTEIKCYSKQQNKFSELRMSVSLCDAAMAGNTEEVQSCSQNIYNPPHPYPHPLHRYKMSFFWGWKNQTTSLY